MHRKLRLASISVRARLMDIIDRLYQLKTVSLMLVNMKPMNMGP
jgi:hypothetical protein